MGLTETERGQFVERYLPLVALIAGRIHRNLPRSFELEDLQAAGRLGLVLAASNYAPGAIRTTASRAEAAYARMRIRGAIYDAVRGERYRYATMRETFSEELAAVYADPYSNSTLPRHFTKISPVISTH